MSQPKEEWSYYGKLDNKKTGRKKSVSEFVVNDFFNEIIAKQENALVEKQDKILNEFKKVISKQILDIQEKIKKINIRLRIIDAE